MFQTGDYVVYSGNGLCLIESIGVPSFQPSKGSPDYYFLRKTDDDSRIYVPVDTPLPIRCPMTQEEAESLLSALRLQKAEIPAKHDQKTIIKLCKDTLRSQTAQATASVIQLLHALHPTGKMSGEEEMILKKAESRLCGELAYALQITPKEAGSKLRAALN